MVRVTKGRAHFSRVRLGATRGPTKGRSPCSTVSLMVSRSPRVGVGLLQVGACDLGLGLLRVGSPASVRLGISRVPWAKVRVIKG